MAATVPRKKNRRQAAGCSFAIRDWPLERYRLPRDGRKWRQVARARAALLLHISTFANGDGTFTREASDAAGKINFSPSAKRLTSHFAERTFYRLCDQLRQLGLLSWTRPDHFHKRIYTVHLSQKHLPDSSEHLPYSETEQVSQSQNTCHQMAGDMAKNTCHSYAGVPSLDTPSNSKPKSLKTGISLRSLPCSQEHFDNLKSLCERSGISFNGATNKRALGLLRNLASVAAKLRASDSDIETAINEARLRAGDDDTCNVLYWTAYWLENP